MNLPQSLRDLLVEHLDEYVEAYGSNPDPEAVATAVVDYLETWADDVGYDDDILVDLEESGELDGPVSEILESEMSSNDELEFTGEELTSLFERMCEIEWVPDEEFASDDPLDEDEEDDDELI